MMAMMTTTMTMPHLIWIISRCPQNRASKNDNTPKMNTLNVSKKHNNVVDKSGNICSQKWRMRMLRRKELQLTDEISNVSIQVNFFFSFLVFVFYVSLLLNYLCSFSSPPPPPPLQCQINICLH
jgi:hypothetical protein